MRRLHLFISILTMLVLLGGAAVSAQKGTSVVRRIKFAPGRTTAVLRGSVHRGLSHDYLLKARAGQTMSVHLVAGGEVSFMLFSPGRTDILAENAKDWSGELPQSGDYRINVLPDTTTERKISYTLEVTVR
jgi:hypothetical protein